MNGLGELPSSGIGSTAMAGSVRAEAQLRRGRPKGRPDSIRYAVGRRMVVAGSWVMGREIDIPDHNCPHPA
jgi:hypothetical protein